MNTSMFSPLPSQGLYAITRDTDEPIITLLQTVDQAIQGGARVIQYRSKKHSHTMTEVMELLNLCRAHKIPLIINDDVELALAMKADGVHLGREDGSLRLARARLGPEAIVGVSCYDNIQSAVQAEQDGASYVAFGRFFPSLSKPLAPLARIETLKEARARMNVPIVAIGGITKENGERLIEAGADLLAVIEGVFGVGDPQTAAEGFRPLWNSGC